jgi:hypothetical protein
MVGIGVTDFNFSLCALQGFPNFSVGICCNHKIIVFNKDLLSKIDPFIWSFALPRESSSSLLQDVAYREE